MPTLPLAGCICRIFREPYPSSFLCHRLTLHLSLSGLHFWWIALGIFKLPRPLSWLTVSLESLDVHLCIRFQTFPRGLSCTNCLGEVNFSRSAEAKYGLPWNFSCESSLVLDELKTLKSVCPTNRRARFTAFMLGSDKCRFWLTARQGIFPKWDIECLVLCSLFSGLFHAPKHLLVSFVHRTTSAADICHIQNPNAGFLRRCKSLSGLIAVAWQIRSLEPTEVYMY